jgi:hypothetical protein
MYCPKCGHPLAPQITVKHNGWTTIGTMQSVSDIVIPQQSEAAPQPFSQASRKTPFRKLEMGADVLVPLTQAVVSGVLAAVLLAMLVPFVPSWGWGVPFVAGGGVIAMVWAGSMLRDRGLWVIEEITGLDIDHDGHTGKPQKRVIEVELREKGKLSGMAELPGGDDLLDFCRMVHAGESFSEQTAQQCGYGVTNFRRLRDIFIQRRWAYWRNPAHPQQGLDLTRQGQGVIKDVALSAAPLPPAGTSNAQNVPR